MAWTKENKALKDDIKEKESELKNAVNPEEQAKHQAVLKDEIKAKADLLDRLNKQKSAWETKQHALEEDLKAKNAALAKLKSPQEQAKIEKELKELQAQKTDWMKNQSALKAEVKAKADLLDHLNKQKKTWEAQQATLKSQIKTHAS
jgi:chromosome segregation ATPase